MPPQPPTLKLEAVKPPPRVDPRVDPEEGIGGNPEPPTVAEMFVYLSSQLSEIAADARGARAETRELRAEAMPHILRLNRRVFGSKPPPFAPASAPGLDVELGIVVPSAPPLAAAVVTQRDSLELLGQEVSNVAGSVGELASKVEVLTAINAQQSRTMGLARPDVSIGRKARAYVGSRAGMRDLVLLVVAVSGLIGVWRGSVAPPPMPSPLSVPSGSR